jgi:hypothetical protein
MSFKKQTLLYAFVLAFLFSGAAQLFHTVAPAFADAPNGEQILRVIGSENTIRATGGQFSGFQKGDPLELLVNKEASAGVFQTTSLRTDSAQPWCKQGNVPSEVTIIVSVTVGDVYLQNSSNSEQPVSEFLANASFSCGTGATDTIPKKNIEKIGFVLDTNEPVREDRPIDVTSAEKYSFAPEQGKTTSDGKSIRGCGGIYMQATKCTEFTYRGGQAPHSDYGDVRQLVFTGTLITVHDCRAEIEITIPENDVKAAAESGASSVNGQAYLSKNLENSNGLGNSRCLSDKEPNTQIQVKTLEEPVNGGADDQASDRRTITITGTLANTVFQFAAPGELSEEGDIFCGAEGLSWIFCPFIQLAVGAANVIDSMIMDMLNVGSETIFEGTDNTGSPQSGYYTAWNSFRIIATALLVIGGLVMVASTALGFDFLDAYTIRKTLPRLLIAAIGISLSWPLMEFVVGFFDTLGFSIRSLIYAPFRSLETNGISIGVGIASYLVVGGAALILGFASLTLVLTAVLALLVGFVILLIRQIAIIMLVIIAPVAIACYVLPNTQKVWKLWSDNFLGLMLMFPIISALIAAGHVFAAVSFSTGAPTTGFTQIVGLIAYFIPYFLLPLAARLATGVIGTLAGFANDRSRGVFDRLKKKRSDTAADRIKRAGSNSLYDNSTKRGRAANTLASWAVSPGSNMAYAGRRIPGLKKAGSNVAYQVQQGQIEQTGKLFEEINKMGFNDKGYRAMAGFHDGMTVPTRDKLRAAGLYNKAPTNLNQMRAVAKILGESEDGAERLGANAFALNEGRLANLYRDPEMGKASIGGAAMMGLAAHGFADDKDLAQGGNMLMGNNRENAGMAQAIVNQSQLLGARSRPDIKAGYGSAYDARTGQFVSGMSNGRDIALLKSLNSHDVAGAKSGFMDNMKSTYKEVLTGEMRPEYATKLRQLQQKRNSGTALTSSEQANYEGLVKRQKDAASIREATQEQLFQWVSPYSQASADVKAKAQEYISEFKLQEAYEKYQRREVNPERRGEGGGGGEGGGEGGGGH